MRQDHGSSSENDAPFVKAAVSKPHQSQSTPAQRARRAAVKARHQEKLHCKSFPRCYLRFRNKAPGASRGDAGRGPCGQLIEANLRWQHDAVSYLSTPPLGGGAYPDAIDVK
jgi:hypothetical protein